LILFLRILIQLAINELIIMSKTVIHPHITRREDIGHGAPIIEGTRTHVKNIVAYYRLGYSPDELAQAFPHLTLAQIYDALSYYYDNAEEIEALLKADREATLTNVG
jgi:uncharacterized protein (DUF433 family)